ncbi:MAG: patatin-like phospholipase family protein [Schleiferiaceae bacterium]|nr:patatin-like phospholipase family protein [Schleiferiaceae bacterium]
MPYRLLLFTLLFTALEPAFGQMSPTPPEKVYPDSTAGRDLKIGLVLSGGGAKCLSQIGALKVIEEAGVQIDYIAGTSMGAIVGAMYALGFPVSEIERYLLQVNWEALLANEIPHDRLSFLDRPKAARYAFTLPIESGKPRLPRGLNEAQYILKELSFLTQQSYRYADFSQFPIPFLCMATNLETGQGRVFEEGSLLKALRASASFPSLFVPYAIDDTLYVDGGVVNNYPLEPLQEKDLDYLIGIDVQDYLHRRQDLRSVLQVLEQISTLVNTRQQSYDEGQTDLLIEPDLAGQSITDFSHMDSTVAAGERAARRHWKALRALAQRDQPAPSSTPVQLPLTRIRVEDIALHGHNTVDERFLLGKIGLDTGTTYSTDRLATVLDLLYGTHYFENVYYTLEPFQEGYRLHFHFREKEHLNTLSLGVQYNTDFKAAALLNYTHRGLLFRHDQLNLDAAIGENPRLRLQYFLDRGYIPTLGLKFRGDQFDFRTYQQGNFTDQLRYRDYSLSLFLQSTIAHSYALGGGIQLENSQINSLFGSQPLQDFDRSFINYYGFLDFNSLDDPYFPRDGFHLEASYRLLAERIGLETFREPTSVLDLQYRETLPLGAQITLLPQLRSAITIGPTPPFPYQIHLGSMGKDYINYIYPFAGYRFMELSGRNLIMAGLEAQIKLGTNHFLHLRGNAARMEPTFDDLLTTQALLDGYALGYSFRSPLGPLSLYFASSSQHKSFYSYINLGFWF